MACYQYLHAGGLDVVDMHKNVGAAVIGRDKAISAICIEEFDPPTLHVQLIRSQRSAPRPAVGTTGRGLCCIVLAVILLMAPAAFHRIAYGGENTEAFYRLGSCLIVVAALPMALSITLDLYVAATRAFETRLPAILTALGIGLVLLFLWGLQPLVLRARRSS